MPRGEEARGGPGWSRLGPLEEGREAGVVGAESVMEGIQGCHGGPCPAGTAL